MTTWQGTMVYLSVGCAVMILMTRAVGWDRWAMTGNAVVTYGAACLCVLAWPLTVAFVFVETIRELSSRR